MTTDPTEHPRPLLRRPVTPLDGTWEFALDRDGRRSGPGAVAFDGTITVPFAPETPAGGGHSGEPVRRVWYRRPLPAARPDHRTLLHFGAVDRVADVWVGGAHVATHEGGYTPWSIDVTDALGDGDARPPTLGRRRDDGLLPDLDRRPAGDRAVVLSEFGGIALRAGDEQSGAWGYGDAGSPAELVDRYRALWAAVHASDVLAGACWTQLTDTYQEVNGLLRADRAPKADLAELAAATRGRS